MSVEPGEIYVGSTGTRYEVADRSEWFGGVVPTGKIVGQKKKATPNLGVQVILVNAPREEKQVEA